MADDKSDIGSSGLGKNQVKYIIPGLIELNLNIMHALDMHMIEDAKHNLSKLIEKEHPIVTTVHKNMIAVLKLNIPKEKREGRIELEQSLSTNPHNLNTLADLEHVYREIYRVTEANRCRDTIDRILKSEAEEDMKEKTICLLEQGYAILVERTLINESTMEIRIKDLHKMLDTEHEKSEGRRKACLERGLHYQMQVLRNVQTASEIDRENGQFLQKLTSIQKFKMAEKLSSSLFPHLLWNYYYAKALNQYFDTFEFVHIQSDENKHERTIITLEALKKFWNVAKNCIGDDMQTFKARAYAYIGHILIKRSALIQSSKGQFELLRNSEFIQYMNCPLDCLKKAYEFKSDDITVLTRYGRAIWNKSQNLQNREEKLKVLMESEKILTKSIKIDDKCNTNWFAYSTRMIVRKDISLITIEQNKLTAKEYLQKAMQDGHLCFTTRSTRKDMTILAEICQKLAKFPNTSKYGPQFVSQTNYLHQALDYLLYATYLSDPPEIHWTFRLASCLFDLGEYEQAVEWQRKAWFLSSPSYSSCFYMMCLFMLTMFEERNIWKNADEKHFREFLYVLYYAKNKHGDELLTSSIKGVLRNRGQETHKLFMEVLVNRSLPLREQEINIIQFCLNIFIRQSYRTVDIKRKYEILLQKVKQVVPEKETEFVLSEIVGENSLKPLSDDIKACAKDFKYDFFVCHSHRDADWVTNILIRHLEGKFDERNIAFKGCIADRDFVPGISVLDNIIAAIKGSHKVILILTKHFITSNWCQYEADHAIIKSLDLESEQTQQEKLEGTKNMSECIVYSSGTRDQTKNASKEETQNKNPENKESSRKSRNRDCVIPIVLEDCKIPDKIKHLNYIDMTEKTDFIQQMMRLKKALLPVEE